MDFFVFCRILVQRFMDDSGLASYLELSVSRTEQHRCHPVDLGSRTLQCHPNSAERGHGRELTHSLPSSV